MSSRVDRHDKVSDTSTPTAHVSKHGGNLAILLIGAVLAVVFAASTAYSGMKAGLTVAAGIPGAIIGSGLVKVFARSKGLYGKNLIQGMSSGGESIASGMIYVLPAIIIIGQKVNFWSGLIVGLLGALFSVGVASLVENYLIVEEDGKLAFPESQAITEALSSSEYGGESLKFMGFGFGSGGIITALTTQVFGWANSMVKFVGSEGYQWQFASEVNPMLAGIGFVVGPKVALTMFIGTFFANFAITPLLTYFTHLAADNVTLWSDASVIVNQMTVEQVGGNYTKYIGAGMMLCGGLIGALKLIPVIITSVKQTLNARKSGEESGSRLGSMALLGAAVLTFVAGFVFSHNLLLTIMAGVLSLVLSMMFIIVNARFAGTIGCSNAPVSGMTIASLVVMTLVFVIFGWKSTEHVTLLLLFGVFIVTAISVGGAYAQTQKVTYLIDGSRNEMMKYFTIAALIGVVVTVGITKILEPQLAITGAAAPFGLPQANLIATLTSGIMSGELPWIMIIVGIAMAIVLWLLDLPIMTIAIGFYLPIATTSIILIGSGVRWLLEVVTKDKDVLGERVQNGISLSSGLIAGGSIIGLIGIILHVTGVLADKVPMGALASNGAAIVLLIVLILSMFLPLLSVKAKKSGKNA
ncbi:MAG: OPT family oligopeptide transporter [Aerococcus sp.]|nr:OPT family oligopeptide transporter [Aerococcus sp.]